MLEQQYLQEMLTRQKLEEHARKAKRRFGGNRPKRTS